MIGIGDFYTAFTPGRNRRPRRRARASRTGRLTDWVGAYAYNDDAPRLRELIEAVTRPAARNTAPDS